MVTTEFLPKGEREKAEFALVRGGIMLNSCKTYEQAMVAMRYIERADFLANRHGIPVSSRYALLLGGIVYDKGLRPNSTNGDNHDG